MSMAWMIISQRGLDPVGVSAVVH